MASVKAYVLERSVKKPPKTQFKLCNVGRRYHSGLKKATLKYEQFVPLYELWKGYFDSFRGRDANEEPSTSSSAVPVEKDERLLKADYHGCLLCVSVSSNPSQVGLSGIVIKETKNAFLMVTRTDRLITIQKQGTAFDFVFQDKIYRIFGDNFRATAAGRCSKRFKNLCVPFLA